MALIAEERIKVFLILGIPLAKPVAFDSDLSKKEIIDNRGGFPEFPYYYSDEAITAVDTRLAALTADEELMIQDIIVQWDVLKYETVVVATDKIKLSYDKARSHLKSLLLALIPVYVDGGSSSSLSIG